MTVVCVRGTGGAKVLDRVFESVFVSSTVGVEPGSLPFAGWPRGLTIVMVDLMLLRVEPVAILAAGFSAAGFFAAGLLAAGVFVAGFLTASFFAAALGGIECSEGC